MLFFTGFAAILEAELAEVTDWESQELRKIVTLKRKRIHSLDIISGLMNKFTFFCQNCFNLYKISYKELTFAK